MTVVHVASDFMSHALKEPTTTETKGGPTENYREIPNVRGTAGNMFHPHFSQSPQEHQERYFREEFITSNMDLDETPSGITIVTKEKA